MKVKTLLIAMLFAIGFTAAYAQQPNGTKPQRLSPVELANKQTEGMVTELKLDEKQKTAVADINLKYAKMREEVFQSNKENKEVFQSKMKELNSQKKAELKKVLTADQFDQLKQWEQKQKEQKQKQHQSKKGSQPAEKTN